jgi:hypothetical protein
MFSRVPQLAVMTTLTCCLQCGGDMVVLPTDTAQVQQGGGSPATPSPGGAGGTSGVGGSPVPATGGTSVAPAPACTPQLNLLGGNLGSDGNWIGGIASSSADNPCGVQGLIYFFGDSGLDNVPGTEDDTCPYLDQSVSPCSNGRCCVKGKTHQWPWNSNSYSESVWGCGIGISLNDPGTGGGTQPYAGLAKGFTVKVSGVLNGQVYRIGYTQLATPCTTPYEQSYSIGDNTIAVGFSEVECPTWSASCVCVPPGPHPHALQVWVVGGDVAGDFELCIDAVYPML